MKTEELVTKITDFINSYNCDEKGFVEQMSREHRTLQQSFTRLMFKWIEHCASNDYHFDGRNEATHRTSKELIKAFAMYKEEQEPSYWANVKPSDFLPLV